MPQTQARIVRKLIQGLLLRNGRFIQFISPEATQDLKKILGELREKTYPTYGDVQDKLCSILASVGEQHAEKVTEVQDLEMGFKMLERNLLLTREMEIVLPLPPNPRPAATTSDPMKKRKASINLPPKKKARMREIKFEPGERVEVPAHPLCLPRACPKCASSFPSPHHQRVFF